MVQYLLYKLGMWLALTLPIRVSYAIAGFIAILQYGFCSKDRRAVINNIKVALGTQDEKLLRQKAKFVFINFAKYLVDFLRFSVVDERYISKNVKIEGSENLKEAAMRGKGIIALTAHLGNWELAGAVTVSLGYPVTAVALNHKDRRVNELFIRQRQIKGMEVVSFGAFVRRCYVALKNNCVIGLVGDRDFTNAGIATEFLGKTVRIPRGPAMFHLKAGAAIVPTFAIRQPDDSYRMIFEKPIEYKPIGKENEDLAAVTKEFVKTIERFIRQYPEQWFMFREFWAEDANKL